VRGCPRIGSKRKHFAGGGEDRVGDRQLDQDGAGLAMPVPREPDVVVKLHNIRGAAIWIKAN
jgi:hypothetical protein